MITYEQAVDNCEAAIAKAQETASSQELASTWLSIAYEWRQLAEDVKG